MRVEGRGLSLAVRDDGGAGSPVLLLHGAGATLLAWSALAPRLAARHRVLAMDLRGQGRSDPGPWGWPAVLADVEAVLTRFGVEDAALVGHSLGGMVAALYASEHPATSAVVNVDGHGGARPEQYPGLGPDVVRERLAEARRLQEAQAGRILAAAEVEAVLASIPAAAQEAVRRAARELPDGRWQLQPERETALAMLGAIDALDLLTVYRRIACPLLIVCATQAGPAPSPELQWLPELHAARVAGLRNELAALAAERPSVAVDFLETTHARVLREPGLAGRIDEFLGDAA